MGVGGVPRGPRVGGPRMGQQQPRPMGQPGPQPMTMMARPGMPPVPAMVGAQVRPQQSFKYTPTARNPPQQAVLVQGQEPLTASMLAAAPPQEQKQMLGERLFPLIQRMFPDLAGKITGMLLEIEDQNSLKGKVEEAVAVLQAHQGKGEKK